MNKLIRTRSHKQKIVQKRNLVDEKIAPLIRWMNNLNGVITHFSCQGAKTKEDPKFGTSTIPYVAFYCFFPTSLYYIFTYISPYCCEIITSKYPNEHGPIRYGFYFESPKKLKECISNLPKIEMDIYEV